MAVPKKKTSKSRTRSRRAAAWKLRPSSRSTCPRCGAAKLPHGSVATAVGTRVAKRSKSANESYRI